MSKRLELQKYCFLLSDFNENAHIENSDVLVLTITQNRHTVDYERSERMAGDVSRSTGFIMCLYV